MPTPLEADRNFMTMALALARRGLGQVAPNPAVGCVVVRDGRVVGRGWTAPGGRPHAEDLALKSAGEAARGGTAYVTLEPCDHHGLTGPCSLALIEAGIDRVVAAVQDPDPRVSGRGLRRLRDGGLRVDVGIEQRAAEEVNGGHFTRIALGRPMVTWKAATSLDGRIATRVGDSRWITGARARARGHLLRASHDAILVGTGTALADDPRLDVRLPGLESRSPIRVVLDRRCRLPADRQVLATTEHQRTWIVTAADQESRVRRRPGLEVLTVPLDETTGLLSLHHVLEALGGRGVTRLLVEGGGELAGALLRADLVDRIAWFRGPIVVGGDGLPSAAPFGVDRLDHARGFVRISLEVLGDDMLECFVRRS